MPLHEYRCRKCEEVFEELIRRDDDEATLACPRCGAKKPKRLMSAAAVSTGKSGAAPCGAPRGGGCGGNSGFG